MKKTGLPKVKSVAKLAEFWDTHDLTDFEAELERVAKPVFARRKSIKIPLQQREANIIDQLARRKGVSQEQLIRAWVLQKIAPLCAAPQSRRAT